MDLWELSDLSTPWCVHVAATLRIATHIEAGHTEIADLAAAAKADTAFLHRVLTQLVAHGLFLEPTAGRFALNDSARPLLNESFLLGLDLDGFGGRMANAWSSLLTAVRTGKPAYHQVFGGDFWSDLDSNPAISAQFDALMGPAGHGTPDPHLLCNPEDWESVRHVVDVGGGTGAQLVEVLRAHPGVRGTLVDLPRPVAGSAEVFQAAGVADRVTTVAQSFFDPLPAGADLYLLKNVLGDWPDPQVEAILRRCCEAARPNGRVVIVTNTGPNEPAPPDLLMLVLVGGKSRTIEELQHLAGKAGMKTTAAGPQPSGRFIVEFRPV